MALLRKVRRRCHGGSMSRLDIRRGLPRALAGIATSPRPRARLFEPLQGQVLRTRRFLLRHLAGPGRRHGHVHDHVPEPLSRAVDCPHRLAPAGPGVATVSPDIECGPAGFGVAKFPVAIPRRHQGKTVTFEIGVDADYPLGKGREVRFRNGRTIRHNSRFRSLTVVVQAFLHCLSGISSSIRRRHPLDAASGRCGRYSGRRRRDRKCSGACRRTSRCAMRWNGNGTSGEH